MFTEVDAGEGSGFIYVEFLRNGVDGNQVEFTELELSAVLKLNHLDSTRREVIASKLKNLNESFRISK